jgi:hypothetical protein
MAFISNNLKYIRYFTIMMSLLINLIILLYVEKEAEDKHKTISNWQNTWLIRGLGLFLVVYSFSVVYYSIYQRLPEIKRRLAVHPVKLNVFALFDKMTKTIALIMEDTEVVWYCIYFICAVLGIAWERFMFAICIFDLIVANSTLKAVIQAVWKPIRELLLTVILLIVFMYVFSFVGFKWFEEDFQAGDGAMNCSTV